MLDKRLVTYRMKVLHVTIRLARLKKDLTKYFEYLQIAGYHLTNQRVAFIHRK